MLIEAILKSGYLILTVTLIILIINSIEFDWKVWITYLVVVILPIVVISVIYFPYALIIVYFLIFLFNYIQFKYALKSILLSFSCFIIHSIGAILCMAVLRTILGYSLEEIDSWEVKVFSLGLESLFIVILSFMLKNVIKRLTRGIVFTIELKQKMKLISLEGFVLISIFFFLSYYVDGSENLFLNLLFLTLISGGVTAVYFARLARKQKKQQEHEELQQLKDYAKNLEKVYLDMRKFRHDYINILASMSGYIQEKDLIGLECYFQEKVMVVSQDIEMNNFKLAGLSQLELPEIKGIVASKMIQAQELGIDTDFEATEKIDQVRMNSLSLCRCLGILLDNAIEETMEMNQASIKVGFIKRSTSLVIVVMNSCRTDTPKIHQLIKRDFSIKGAGRGLGLSNLQEEIDRFSFVTLDTRIENELFIQEIEILN
ncbi:GHKL domain-containing protein [Carnobacterium gallinarum]